MKTTEMKQPPVFKLVLITAAFERFGFFILSFMLVLYAKATYGMSDSNAFGLFAAVTALAFMTPVIGGYISDNILGIKRSMILGLSIEALGLFLLAIPVGGNLFFALALSFVTIGSGLFKTCPANLLGRSYKEKDPRIDSGFTFYYMAANIGSFSASILSGIFESYFGWHVAFFIAGVGLLLSILAYYFFRKTAQNLEYIKNEITKLPLKTWLKIFAIIFAAGLLGSLLILHTTINNILFFVLGVAICWYYIYEMGRSTAEDKLRIIVCLSLIFIGAIYFSLYFQAFTSIELFINRIVNRNVLGFNVPTEAYLGLNALWVIILGPILAFSYQLIAKKFGRDIFVVTKFGMGLLFISLCFFVLVLSCFFADSNFHVSSLWMVLTFCLYTLGEMLISALGVAMITKFIPKRMYGVTMGTWFFGSALAALSSGWFASLASIPNALTDPQSILKIYSVAFTKIGVIGLVFTSLVFLARPYIKKIADVFE